jgi:hypothetical protein
LSLAQQRSTPARSSPGQAPTREPSCWRKDWHGYTKTTEPVLENVAPLRTNFRELFPDFREPEKEQNIFTY